MEVPFTEEMIYSVTVDRGTEVYLCNEVCKTLKNKFTNYLDRPVSRRYTYGHFHTEMVFYCKMGLSVMSYYRVYLPRSGLNHSIT